MDRRQAGFLVGRLSAQWPSIGDTDLGADDWVNALVAVPWERGQQIVTAFVDGWTKDRPPRLADWQELAREYARREIEADRPPQLAAPVDVPASAERVAQLIALAKTRLSDATRKARPARAAGPVSRYDREPIHWGMPGTTMTPEERAAQLAEAGGRHVRRRNIA